MRPGGRQVERNDGIKKKLLLILFLLLLIPIASASVTEFRVTVSQIPGFFKVEYTPVEMVINYTVNSSVNYGSGSWVLYGTTDDITYLILNESLHQPVVANVPYTFNLTCPALYSKYWLEFDEGFDNPAANLNLTFMTAASSGPSPSTGRITFHKRLDTFGNMTAYYAIVPLLTLSVGAIFWKKKRSKRPRFPLK